MVKVVSVDMRGVGDLVKGIYNAMISTGQIGDITEITRDETRKLSLQIAKPSTSALRKGERGVAKDVRSVFRSKPSNQMQGTRHSPGTKWLMAGPDFLLGTKPSNVTSDASLSRFYSRKRKMGKKTVDVGNHGRQHVTLINRLIVPGGKMRKLFKSIAKNLGKREASFAETAGKLGESKIPAENKKHFPTGKNITKIQTDAASPSITFGSNAHGITALVPKIQSAISVRKAKMDYRIKLMLRGYAKDNNSGGKIKKHGKDGASD